MFAAVASAGVHFRVFADDRTGALETAGACADVGFEAIVVAHDGDAAPHVECVVVDLASRHLPSDLAAARASVAPGGAAHKIDSSLRGNWAHELVARHAAGGMPVLVVPAFPAAGRTCRNGVVYVDGHPVAEGAARDDVRAPVRSSRPADHLRDAGAPAVAELTPETVGEWLASPPEPFAVCDAADDTDLSVIGQAWARHPNVTFAGTAGSIAAAAAALAPGRDRPARRPARRPTRRPTRPGLSSPALVVCGSLHPVAEAQVNALVAGGARPVSVSDGAGVAVAALRSGQHVVLTTGPFAPDATRGASSALGAVAREIIASGAASTVVVIGGDTTAAVLGNEPMRVGGTLAPGIAWCAMPDGSHIVTKPGGFGHTSTIVDLFEAAQS